tara:strand:- start:284 stop:865 length:582 start_codon:yes stop_codon:yes gene_type:complete
MAKEEIPATTSSTKNNVARSPFSNNSTNVTSRISRMHNTVRVRGSSISPDSSMATLNRGYKKLHNNGSCEKINNTVSQNNFAIAILQSIGCSICDESKEFTLLETQTDNEIIDNENIIDTKDYKNIKNERLSAQDKFSNSADPFYNLDDAPAKTTARQSHDAINKEMISVDNLVKDLVDLNLSKDGTTSKYFM